MGEAHRNGNFAEMMAYVQPLTYFVAREWDRRNQKQGTRSYQVHIISDSQYCRDMGNKVGREAVKNCTLWAAFDAVSRAGFLTKWHWVNRETLDLNKFADACSKLARGALKGYNMREHLLAGGFPSAELANPSGG